MTKSLKNKQKFLSLKKQWLIVSGLIFILALLGLVILYADTIWMAKV